MNDEPNLDCELSPLHDGKWRVKLYHLNLQGQWTDIGTGFVFISKKVTYFYNFFLFKDRIYPHNDQ